jgi:thymidylate synthase
MKLEIQANTTAHAWLELMGHLRVNGTEIGPRGLGTREITGVSVTIHDARANIILHPVRAISYRFMVAEWLFIWYGRNDVATIAFYNRHIAQFSDDGERFNGAYGIPVFMQWNTVLQTLQKDPASRQGIIYIFGYEGQERVSKDVPCTLSLQFLIRDAKLELIATMRSSDIWLGFPYDVFNFTMLQNIMAAQLGVGLGTFSLNIGSSHLYDKNFEGARQVAVMLADLESLRSPRLHAKPPSLLEWSLTQTPPHAESGGSMIQPWATYHDVLMAKSNKEALTWLMTLQHLDV